MNKGQASVNYPSYKLCKLLHEDGFNNPTFLSWEYIPNLLLVTIPTSECKRVVSEKYTPQPTWNEVLNYLCEKYQFIFKVSGGTNGANNERVGKIFFYEFQDKKHNTHFGRNNELHLVYEEMITEYLKVKFSL